MNYFERTLLSFLSRSKIKMEITGFDQDGFSKAVQQESKRRLDMIEYIISQDSGIVSDAEKIASIKQLFRREFYDKE